MKFKIWGYLASISCEKKISFPWGQYELKMWYPCNFRLSRSQEFLWCPVLAHLDYLVLLRVLLFLMKHCKWCACRGQGSGGWRIYNKPCHKFRALQLRKERIKGRQDGCIQIFGSCLMTAFSFFDFESGNGTD